MIVAPSGPQKESGPDMDVYEVSENCYTDWSRANLKEELQKLDNAPSLFGETDKADSVVAAMLARKETLKDALNAKKSPGSRLDWALKQETRAKKSVTQLEESIIKMQTELEEKQETLIQAKRELEEAHTQVICHKGGCCIRSRPRGERCSSA